MSCSMQAGGFRAQPPGVGAQNPRQRSHHGHRKLHAAGDAERAAAHESGELMQGAECALSVNAHESRRQPLLEYCCAGSAWPCETYIGMCLALQVDVYSLGVIMCQLFAGATPYAGMGMPAVLFAVVHKGQRPDVPADMPPDYRDLMQRCWANDMRERCRTQLRGYAFVCVSA